MGIEISNATGSRYVEPWASTIGGVAIVNGANFTITHNLGTTDVTAEMYVNTSPSDVNAQSIFGLSRSSGVTYGWAITSTTTNTITLQLAKGGYLEVDQYGDTSFAVFEYLKIIIFA